MHRHFPAAAVPLLPRREFQYRTVTDVVGAWRKQRITQELAERGLGYRHLPSEEVKELDKQYELIVKRIGERIRELEREISLLQRTTYNPALLTWLQEGDGTFPRPS